MKTLLPLSFLFLVLYSFPAYGQAKALTRNKYIVEQLSAHDLLIYQTQRNIDFEKNDLDFITFDIYLDGFVEGKAPFNLSYDKGILLVNDAPLPKEYNDKYVSDIKAIMTRLNIPVEVQIFKAHTDRFPFLSAEERKHPAPPAADGIGCRYRPKGDMNMMLGFDTKYFDTSMQKQFSKDAVLINALCKDKIIDKPCRVSVRCNESSCYVNNKEMDAKLATKYTAMVEMITGRPVKGSEFTGVSYSPKDLEFISACNMPKSK